MFSIILSHSKLLKRSYFVSKCVQRLAHLIDYSIRSPYQIPENVLTQFHTANASLRDNIQYYFYTGVQVFYKQIFNDIKVANPELTEFGVRTCINNFIDYLKQCQITLECSIPIVRDDGSIDIIHGYRVQHYCSKYPYLGGVRICNKTNLEDLKGLVMLQTLKLANLNLPFIGSFGALKLNKIKYKQNELESMFSAYAVQCSNHKFLNSKIDIYQPDMCTSANEMKWMLNGCNKVNDNDNINAVILGKCDNQNGLEDYYNAPGYVAYYAINNLFMDNDKMTTMNLTPDWCDKTFVVHGFGKVGQSIAKLFVNAGAKCVGVQDKSDSGIFNTNGLNIQHLIEYFHKYGKLKTFPDGYEYQSDLIHHCSDIVVLASDQKVINYFNASNIATKIVVEAAFGAITPNAYKTLLSKNIFVLPDIFIGGGFDIASHLEHIKNLNEVSFVHIDNSFQSKYSELQNAVSQIVGENIVERKHAEIKILDKYGKNNEGNVLKIVIENTMSKVYNDLNTICDKYGLGMDFRIASYVNAIDKLADNCDDFGRPI